MTVVVIGVVALGMALTAAAGRLGSALVARARADSAADAAALAAADMLALGRGSGAAVAAATETASANGATLVTCECGGNTAEVVVEVRTNGVLAGPAQGRAKAEVRFECLGSGSDCAPP